MGNYTKAKIFTFIVFMCGIALAAGVTERLPTDRIQFGKNSSSDDKEIVFDTGSGAANPKLSVEVSTQDFIFNKEMKLLGNEFTLGDGTPGDKNIRFDVGSGGANPVFRWSDADSALAFANDGVNFKNIGTGGGGGGGGTNFLQEQNADFETADPPSLYAPSNGNFTAETTNPLFGEQSGRWDPSTINETLLSPTVTIDAVSGFLGAIGQTCQAEIIYKYPLGANGDYAFQVKDDALNIIAEVPLNTTTGDDSRPEFLSFPCPALGEGALISIESLVADAEVILLDNWFLGTGKNSVNVTQSELIAQAYYPGTASCDWFRNGIGFAPFGANPSCPSIIQTAGTGVVDTTDDDLPNIKLLDLKPGIYTVEAATNYGYSGAVVHQASYAMFDSVSGTAGQVCYVKTYATAGNAASVNNVVCRKTITVTQTDDVTFELYAQENGAGTINMYNSDAQYNQLSWTVTKQPSQAATGITYLTSGEHWDLSLSGGNFDLNGGANFATLTAPAHPNMTMTVNPGSKTAKITCAGTVAASGLNCTGVNEQVGAEIKIATAGRYRICSQFILRTDVNGPTGGQEIEFRWGETSSDSQTILQLAPQSAGGGLVVGSSLSGRVFSNDNLTPCGVFNFDSAGTKTLRLFRTQTVTGATPNNMFIIADGSASLAGRDLNITIEKLGQQMPAPIFPEFDAALDKKVGSRESDQRICSFSAGSTGASGAVDHSSCITSATALGGATLRIAWEPGTWAANTGYACACTVNNTADIGCDVFNVFFNQIDFKTFDAAGSSTNGALQVVCSGLKGD